MAELAKLQMDFAEYIRSGGETELPCGTDPRRMQVYAELFFNNVAGFVENSFPVLKRMLAEEKWRTLLKAFWRQHENTSPYFVDIPAAFVTFLADEYNLASDDVPYLRELAHYEWLELAISIRDVAPIEFVSKQDAALAFSPVAELVQYAFAVHLIAPGVAESVINQPVNLLVFRDADYDVQFIELNTLSLHLLMQIKLRPGFTAPQYTDMLLAGIENEELHQQLAVNADLALQRYIELGVLVACNAQ